MTSTRPNLSQIWRRLSWPDLAAIIFVIFGLTVLLAERSGGAYSFAKFAALLSAGYLVFRAISWWRNRLLWSLRNRLIVAYFFIAVVPVLLLLTLGRAGWTDLLFAAGRLLALRGRAQPAWHEWRTLRPALPALNRACRQRFPTRWWKRRWTRKFTSLMPKNCPD